METDSTPTINPGIVTPSPKPGKKGPSKMVMLVAVAALLALAAAGAFWWQGNNAIADKNKAQAELTALKQKVTDLEKQIATDKSGAKPSNETNPLGQPAAVVPSAEMVANIKAVFASGNSAALEGYMSPTVKLIVAASECCGDRTASQATADITGYMAEATDPWNFSLPAATLASYRSGDYASYFPENAVVGKTNEKVVSFTFNSTGKISGVFWTNSAEVL